MRYLEFRTHYRLVVSRWKGLPRPPYSISWRFPCRCHRPLMWRRWSQNACRNSCFLPLILLPIHFPARLNRSWRPHNPGSLCLNGPYSHLLPKWWVPIQLLSQPLNLTSLWVCSYSVRPLSLVPCSRQAHHTLCHESDHLCCSLSIRTVPRFYYRSLLAALPQARAARFGFY